MNDTNESAHIEVDDFPPVVHVGMNMLCLCGIGILMWVFILAVGRCIISGSC